MSLRKITLEALALLSLFGSAAIAGPIDVSGSSSVGLKAGSKIAIDQTTPGTTNGVQVNAALPAGSNVIGKAAIDQTTPGTTNAVSATNLPATVSTGTGAQGASSPRVTVATDPATVAGTAPVSNASDAVAPSSLNAPTVAYNYVWNGASWDRVNGSTPAQVYNTPSSSATYGIAAVTSTALESCHVLKNGAGNLYNLGVAVQATTGFVQLYNATSAPGAGAVTPAWAEPIVSNGTLGGATYDWRVPLYFSTGITVCFSSATTPFTYTSTSTAMFSGGVQ